MAHKVREILFVNNLKFNSITRSFTIYLYLFVFYISVALMRKCIFATLTVERLNRHLALHQCT